MSEDIYRLVEQFINGELNEQQTVAFNQRLKTEPALAEELRLRQDMHNYLINKEKKDAFKSKLSNISDDFFEKSKSAPAKGIPIQPKKNFQWLAIAASVAILAIALYWVFQPKPNLYAQFAQHEPLQLTKKSNTQSELIKNIEDTFNSGDYSAALKPINDLLKSQATDLQSLIAKAICLMETNQTTEARSIFQDIATGSSVFKTEAQWYSALSYLKENNKELAKIELQKIPASDPDWSSKAKQLLKELK